MVGVDMVISSIKVEDNTTDIKDSAIISPFNLNLKID